MKRTLLIGAIALMALATAASAQLMGSGHYYYSGDGGIPKYTNTVDDNLQPMKDNGYHLWWGPSDVVSWGDTYGYSTDTNLTGARLVVRAHDLDNNLYTAEGEDAAEAGTDADIYLHYWLSWDDDALYITADVIDNHYDVVQAPDAGDWAFWLRDGMFMSMDLTGLGTVDGSVTPNVHAAPVNADEAIFSMQAHWTVEGEATQVMYGEDPDFFQGSTVAGGPSAEGYWFESKITWDLLFSFSPELRGNVGDGYEFKMRFIVPDPDGDDAYGQTFWGMDYSRNNAEGVTWWPIWRLQNEKTTAVEATSWGSIKELYK